MKRYFEQSNASNGKAAWSAMPAAVALVIGMLGSSAVFAVQSWDFNSLCTSSSAQVTNNCGISTTTDFRMTGLSTGTGTSASPVISSSQFSQAQIWDWGGSGLGVVNSNEASGATGPHASDNIVGTDGMLFSFASKVSLLGMKIGWNGTDNATGSYTDSDISVFAWVGGGTPITGGTVAGNNQVMADGGNASGILKMGAQNASGVATTAGWMLVGNYGNLGSNPGNAQTFVATNSNGSQLYSSYWLVSSYHSSYGATSNGKAVNEANDAFKLLAISADKCRGAVSANGNICSEVPEPNSLALLGLAVLAFWAARGSSLRSRATRRLSAA